MNGFRTRGREEEGGRREEEGGRREEEEGGVREKGVRREEEGRKEEGIKDDVLLSVSGYFDRLVNPKMEGICCLEYSSGTVFEGNFQNSKRKGII